MNAAKSLFFDRLQVGSVDDLLPLYKAEEFESPYRSTVPLLDLVKQGGFRKLLRGCDVAEDADLHFEFTVRSPRGRGKASHTDVMARSEGDLIAIEAKWTEPVSEPVSIWLAGGATPGNRSEVLNGWLSLLQSHSAHPLVPENFFDLPYRMVHRAASACAAGVRPQLLYLKFEPSHEPQTAPAEYWHAQLSEFYGLLGQPASLQFRLATVELKKKPAFAAIAPLPKKEASTALAVASALRKSLLFDFAEPRIQTVGNSIYATINRV